MDIELFTSRSNWHYLHNFDLNFALVSLFLRSSQLSRREKQQRHFYQTRKGSWNPDPKWGKSWRVSCPSTSLCPSSCSCSPGSWDTPYLPTGVSQTHDREMRLSFYVVAEVNETVLYLKFKERRHVCGLGFVHCITWEGQCLHIFSCFEGVSHNTRLLIKVFIAAYKVILGQGNYREF